MNSISDKRDFDRFPMEFVLEVSAKDSEGKEFDEKTVLEDISGEGAKFITQQAGKYFPGQSLEVTIYLPGPNDVKADMRGTATVVRIDPSGNSGIGEKSQRPRPSGRALKKGNNSLAASIPTLPGGALKGGGQEMSIAVTFDTPLHFERVDVKTQGNHAEP